MSNEPLSRTSAGLQARRALLLVCVLTLSLVASVLMVPRASAMGQPGLGFAEVGLTETEQFQVMGANYAVRTNLTFRPTEMVRVNVTSTLVDWNGNAGGAGSEILLLQRFDGTIVHSFAFTEAAGGPPFVYSASADLSTVLLEPNTYYLRVFIDDTANVFSAATPIAVGVPALANSIETFSDSTFSHPSDVFTPTSTVWVRVIGLANADTSRWDLESFTNNDSVVGGPNTNFDNFNRAGTAYTFSIDLSPFAGTLTQTWSYTLSVRLSGLSFNAAKQIQILEPSVAVASSSIAPSTARQGATNVPMLALSLSLNANWGLAFGPASFPLDRLRVTRTGTGTNADISGVHVYADVNGNGVLDSSDVLLASAQNLRGVPFPVWVGQAGTTMAYLSSAGALHLILTYDISPSATIGNADGAQIAAAADVDLPGTYLAVTGLPATSSNVQITGTVVVTVTDNPGVAPGTAVQGQPNVPIDLLHLDSNGPAVTVTSIAVTFAGTGTTSDVASVSLHVDNGDGIYQPSQDPILAGPAAFPSGGVATFSGLSFAVDSVGRDVWIVYNVSSSATVGHRLGSELPGNASLTVTGATVYNGTFPLVSGTVRVSGPTLTVDWRSLAPAQARQGRQNLTMLQLDLSVEFGQSTISGFRIDKRGTSTLDSDVTLAKVWLDANRDGLFDAGDTLLGSQGFVGGTTVIGGLSLVVTASAPQTAFVTFDISPTATTGVTVVARLATPSYVSVDASTTVSDANFPIISDPSLITAPGSGAFLTVGSVDEAQWTPRVYAGQVNVSMEKLYLSVDANSATITGIRVDKLGTSTRDSDVAALKLYEDADGNGNFSAGDRLLSTTSFVTGLAIFGNLNLVVPVNQPMTLFLVMDFSRTATIGRSVGLRLANAAYVVGNATTTVDPNSFPILSSDVTIYAGTLWGFVHDSNGHPLANITVFLPQLNRTAITDANGEYTFANMPVGTYYVVASASGYQTANETASLTPAAPSQRLNLTLQPNAVVSPGLFLAIAVGGGLALIAVLGLLLFLVSRRRSRCPICGKPKAKDQEVCPECAAKGLHAPGGAPPASPPAQPPTPPSPPSPPEDDL